MPTATDRQHSNIQSTMSSICCSPQAVFSGPDGDGKSGIQLPALLIFSSALLP
ncbi:hypothetical protein PAMP_007969 [Pampus punctatissimus]